MISLKPPASHFSKMAGHNPCMAIMILALAVRHGTERPATGMGGGIVNKCNEYTYGAAADRHLNEPIYFLC